MLTRTPRSSRRLGPAAGVAIVAMLGVLAASLGVARASIPSAPGGVVAAAEGSSIVIAWQPATVPGGSVRTYEIERDGHWIGWTWADARSWTDASAVPGITYRYTVRAVNTAFEWGPRSATVTVTVDAAGGGTAVVLAAGDIGQCGGRSAGVAALMEGRSGFTFAALGDIAYPDGSAADFSRCYDPWFGAVRGRTRPAVGNHEYLTPAASDYFDYFGWRAGARDEGYYSYDLGAWHVVVLNSECVNVGGCGIWDRQYRWLEGDLADTRADCILAYWHRPILTTEGNGTGSRDLVAAFELLRARGADVVLAGHHHVYERWARTDAAGRRSSTGIRSFTVGTGGASRHRFGPWQSGLESRGRSYGLLELTLRPGRYSWEFLPVAGETFTDAGSDTC